MAHKDKVQLSIVFLATPDLVEEGDRIFESPAILHFLLMPLNGVTP